MSKSLGSYYTPKKLSAFIWEHIQISIQGNSEIRILEPSCGNGIFLSEIIKSKRNTNFLIDAVEINKEAIIQAQKSLLNINGRFYINFINEDFLKVELPLKYDLIIGNPPYISRNLLSKDQKTNCLNINLLGELNGNNIRNIWPAFVIKASLSLNSTGTLALVLPGELLQVSYAQLIQSFLKKHYKSIEILTFKDLVFPALGQDVVVLFAYKASTNSGIHYLQVPNIEALKTTVVFPHRNFPSSVGQIKWSNFILNDDDLNFLAQITKHINKVTDFCSSTPGIVTAANEFFIVNKKIVDDYNLEPYCKPILQKSEFVDKTVSIDEQVFEELKKSNKPCYFINLGDINFESLPVKVQNYLQLGVEQKYHKRYKCSQRNPWYNIPSVWIPEGIIFKRFHLFPKLLKNEAKVLFTDTAYRIRTHVGYDINSFIYSFYNSITLVFCELYGRFYGGGVSELTPNEFRNLPIPYKSISENKFLDFKKTFSNYHSIEELLKQNDAELLVDIDLDQLSIKRLGDIRQKLIERRLKK